MEANRSGSTAETTALIRALHLLLDEEAIWPSLQGEEYPLNGPISIAEQSF
jgi:hypothetical protein